MKHETNMDNQLIDKFTQAFQQVADRLEDNDEVTKQLADALDEQAKYITKLVEAYDIQQSIINSLIKNDLEVNLFSSNEYTRKIAEAINEDMHRRAAENKTG